jgi:hypothetical protein
MITLGKLIIRVRESKGATETAHEGAMECGYHGQPFEDAGRAHGAFAAGASVAHGRLPDVVASWHPFPVAMGAWRRRVLRNFYGQLRVADFDEGALGIRRIIVHGRINHGEQFISPAHSRRPTAYYCEQSGIGQALLSRASEPPLKVGVLGLGAGTLATYGRPGDEMRMYEINDQVLDLARNDFSYLAESRARIVPVLGDGRLMLEREPVQNFDLLAIDAFSGDSIPTHLLTIEAMQAYLRHMKSDGILAVHITNRYLDLRPVVAAAARQIGLTVLAVELDPDEDDAFCRHSVWALLVRPERSDNLLKEIDKAETLAPKPGFAVWTDGFSNLLGILK